MKEELKVAAVFIGTIIGAGLASGQEILQFFSRFGRGSFIGILICFILYILLSLIFINMAYKKRFNSYNDLVDYCLGKKLGFIADWIITIFIFFSNTIMISGGGAMLNEYIGIDKRYGIFIMAIVSFLVALFSTNGVIAINSIIVPLSTFIVLILGFFVFEENSINITLPLFNNENVYGSAIIYACFNFMTAIGVLYPMAREVKSRESFVKGCILGSIVLTLLGLIINYNILTYYPASFNSEIPNLYVAKNHGPLLPLYLTVIIWLEMFTTEVGCLYSLSKRMQNVLNKSYFYCLLTILLISIPFSFIGFSNLIKMFYPPFGLISMLILLIGVIKYVILRK